MLNNKNLMAVCAFNERIHSLITDGYSIVFNHQVAGLYFAKLVHRNGNRVSIRLSLDDGILSQTTNGKITFSCPLCKS